MSESQRRLATAIATLPYRARKEWDPMELASIILKRDPSIGADMELGAAWRAVLGQESAAFQLAPRPKSEPKP
jgi:hypothetical protein